jgi:hypothetical protein
VFPSLLRHILSLFLSFSLKRSAVQPTRDSLDWSRARRDPGRRLTLASKAPKVPGRYQEQSEALGSHAMVWQAMPWFRRPLCCWFQGAVVLLPWKSLSAAPPFSGGATGKWRRPGHGMAGQAAPRLTPRRPQGRASPAHPARPVGLRTSPVSTPNTPPHLRRPCRRRPTRGPRTAPARPRPGCSACAPRPPPARPGPDQSLPARPRRGVGRAGAEGAGRCGGRRGRARCGARQRRGATPPGSRGSRAKM